MKIHPNAVWGYPATPFIIAFIILSLGDVAVTILLFDTVGYYLLLPLVGGLLLVALFTIRASASWLQLTSTGIEYKTIQGPVSVPFANVKEVVYTDKAYVGNNVKPCLYIVGPDGKVMRGFFADMWSMKDIKAFYDAIPDTAVPKRIVEKGY